MATLVAVSVMLHPKGSRAAAGSAENSPATVTVEKVELHAAPSPGGTALAVLAEGSRLRVTSDQGQWIEVETEEGERGFVPAESIERDADREARQRRAKMLLAFAPVFAVVGVDTEIALAPYPLAAQGGKLTKGSVIAIHSVDHSYFAYRDKKWGLAYVSSAHVDLVPADPRQPAIEPEKIKPLKNLSVIDLEAEPPPEDEMTGEASETGVLSAPEPAPRVVEPPNLVSRVEPDYPEMARRAGIEGTVELEISIDTSGRVTDVEVVRGLPLGISDAAAEAVRRWRYQPAHTASGPIAARKTIRIRFALHSDDAP